MPSTSPRRAVNQRVATIALSTSAVMPVPTPTTIPHSATSCQSRLIASASNKPETISAIAASTTRRTP